MFDSSADRLISTAFTNVSTTDPAGFFQHPLGGNTAPACALVALEPTVECDSFVTLGVDCFDVDDGSSTDPDFDGTAFNTSGEVRGGWFNSAPSNGQGAPDANGRVLIARFSYKQNKTTSGEVCLFTKLAGSEEITEFLLLPFDCANPGMQGGAPPLGGPTIWFVDDDGDAAHGCTTWGDACPDLQIALGLANATDQIWVAKATTPYLPDSGTGDRSASFQLKTGVSIYGGFAGGEQKLDDRDFLANETILSGDIGTPGANGDNSYHVVTGSGTNNTARLDGFTITGGNADAQVSPDNSGGGMLNIAGSPTVANCTFTANSARQFGGGMQNDWDSVNPSNPLVTNCTFSNNVNTHGVGGGLYNGHSAPTITNCTFVANLAVQDPGGGAGGMCNNHNSHSIVTNCTFTGNSAGTAGGMGNNNGSNPTIINSQFRGNTANAFGAAAVGGGMYNSTSSPTVSQCIFIGNSANYGGGVSITTKAGGAPASAIVTNCIFAGNVAGDSAGGIFNNLGDTQGGSSTITNCLFSGNAAGAGGGIGNYTPTQNVTVTNCTFSGNSAGGIGGGVLFQGNGVNSKLDNCVFWGNSDTNGTNMDESAQIFVLGTSPAIVVTYSDIMGQTQPGPFCDDPNGVPPCEGNIDDNPVFLEDPVQPSGSWTVNATYDPATDQTTFTDANATWIAGALVGQFLNPDTAQSLQSLIVSNTRTEIVVWADFSELGDNNEDYKVYDYHLDSASDSPCIDRADNIAVTLCNADLDGNERIVDDPASPDLGNGDFPFVDMGAYEFGGGPDPDCDGNGFAGSCCPADFDGDGIVNAFDLAQLLGDWDPCPDPCTVGISTCECRADLDNSCEVKAFDLAKLLGDWGPCL